MPEPTYFPHPIPRVFYLSWHHIHIRVLPPPPPPPRVLLTSTLLTDLAINHPSRLSTDRYIALEPLSHIILIVLVLVLCFIFRMRLQVLHILYIHIHITWRIFSLCILLWNNLNCTFWRFDLEELVKVYVRDRVPNLRRALLYPVKVICQEAFLLL
ncbi:hypothetical protein BDR06DRAFT_627326 [Suillus hirtellus]|nr:hypothetical protein BDR06DRAFT_627326 [Suillus hirtellus]